MKNKIAKLVLAGMLASAAGLAAPAAEAEVPGGGWESSCTSVADCDSLADLCRGDAKTAGSHGITVVVDYENGWVKCFIDPYRPARPWVPMPISNP
jgi:hypothetical protein